MAQPSAKIGAVEALIRDAIDYRDTLGKAREVSREYFDGTMRDIPSEPGRSSAVSLDVREMVKKALPSLVRTILGGEKVVEYQPTKEGGDEQAEQASDFVNLILLDECGGFRAIHDAMHDAVLLRNGILRAWLDERRTVQVSRHTGLDEEGLAALVAGDDVEVLEHSAQPGGADPLTGQPVNLHDVKIKRVTTQRRVRAEAVPPEEWIIHPDALSVEDALVCGIARRYRRADLVAMGYDAERIAGLPEARDSEEEDDRRLDRAGSPSDQDASLQEVDYYEAYVRIDADGDGIPELRRMVMIGGLADQHMFEDDYWDEAPFADIAAERRPHQWEGRSIADDTRDIQRIKTALIRQTLDNLYWQNMPQPVVQEGAILNPDAVLRPSFGKPIRIRQGGDARAALAFNPVPFVAKESFAMLEYWDAEAKGRTGISDASGGLAPDALQNMTAKASAMIESAGVAQTELMVRTVAEGLKRFFKLLLKLVIQHQDRPRTVRLRGKWVQFDPRAWDADMDATVNIGLGAGTRERDMMMMQMVIGLQEKLLVSMGPDNPFVKPDNLFAGVTELTAAAGIKTPGAFFTKPDPAEVEQKLQAMRQKPSPEQEKAQAQMMIEQAKAQVTLQIEREKAQIAAQAKMLDIQAQREKERAQMEADLQVRMAELEKEAQAARVNAAFEREKFMMQQQLEREKLAVQVLLAQASAKSSSTTDPETGATVTHEQSGPVGDVDQAIADVQAIAATIGSDPMQSGAGL